MTPKSAADDASGRLLAAAGTEPAFEELLAAHRHRTDFPAPEGLRRLLLGRQVLRFELSVAYRNAAGKSSLLWWLPEVGFPGGVDEVGAYVRKTLESGGLSCRPGPDGLSCSARAAGMTQQVDVEGPRPWTGGKGPACGLRIRWSVDAPDRGPAPGVGALLARLPFLRDERVDPSLMAGLDALEARELSAGGTWSRYYSWDVRLVGGPGLREKLAGLLRAAGFAAEGRERGYESFSRAATGSHALLYEAEADGSVRLSLQPES